MRINPIVISEAWIAPNDETRIWYIAEERSSEKAHQLATPRGSQLGKWLEEHIDRSKAMAKAIVAAHGIDPEVVGPLPFADRLPDIRSPIFQQAVNPDASAG